MKNENAKPVKKTSAELEELKKKQAEAKKPEKETTSKTVVDDDDPEVTREGDFEHVHPTHAKHRPIGLDHEPGAL